MKKFACGLIVTAVSFSVYADSFVRVKCDDKDVGAEVYINGKFVGNCPVDVPVHEGTAELRARKIVDDDYEQLFTKQLRVIEGVPQKIELLMSAPQLTVKAKQRKDVADASAQLHAAEAGDIEAMKKMVEYYDVGIGVKKDSSQANLWRGKASTAEEQALWQRVQSSANYQVVQSYLDRYPNSSHVAEAQEMLAAIRKNEAENPPGKVFKDCPDCPEMVIIPSGSFEMGSSISHETIMFPSKSSPVHRVTIGQRFALGKTEVTQGLWKKIMGNNPSEFKSCGDNCPVEQVNWDDTQEFIRRLNQKTGKQYRLPSEAEWEYVCHAGGTQIFCGSDNPDSVGWYEHEGFFSKRDTRPVAGKQPNAFGMYDMSGNVGEWVEDRAHLDYNGAPMDGSAWQGNSKQRVKRGGSWGDYSEDAPAVSRRTGFMGDQFTGFRLARTLP